MIITITIIIRTIIIIRSSQEVPDLGNLYAVAEGRVWVAETKVKQSIDYDTLLSAKKKRSKSLMIISHSACQYFKHSRTCSKRWALVVRSANYLGPYTTSLRGESSGPTYSCNSNNSNVYRNANNTCTEIVCNLAPECLYRNSCGPR